MYDNQQILLKVDLETSEFADDIKTITEVLNSLRADIEKCATKIANLLNTMIKKLGAITGEIKNVSLAFQECAEFFEMLLKANDASEDLGDSWLEVSSLIAGVLSGIATVIGFIIQNIGAIKSVLQPVISAVLSVITKIPGWVGIVAAAIAAVTALVTLFWDEISAFLSGAWDTITGIAVNAITWINENVIVPLGQMISTFFSNVGAWIVDAWNSAMAILAVVATWFHENIIEPIIHLLEPALEWFSQLFQGIWQLVKDVCYNITAVIKGSVEMVFATLLTIGAWVYLNVIEPVGAFFAKLWEGVKTLATDAWNGIVAVFMGVATWFQQNVIQPVTKFFSDLWSGICRFATDAWNGIVEVFTGVAAWFDRNVVQPLVKIINGIADGFRNVANGVIGFVNGMIRGIISGINGVINALNRVRFSVPDWVPGLGGSTLGFNLKTLTPPQIPYLAKGAVLPANKPFMAMVGDQHHGTNIEAPLATIQEAVGLVMEEHISAMMAGFEALLQEQQALRRTVASIQIGDDVIGEAVERYNYKQCLLFGFR